MIPLRYREKLPPYWYENEVAETHYVATGGEVDYQREKSKDIANQFLLPYATWGLDIWDWIYFGDVQSGTYEQRRERIRRKKLSKIKFTIPNLKILGKTAGDLLRIDEDFTNKVMIFVFSDRVPVTLAQFTKDFARIRPVHVRRMETAINATTEKICISGNARYDAIDYLLCGKFYPEDDLEGRIYKGEVEVTEAERHHTIDYLLTNTFYPEQEV